MDIERVITCHKCGSSIGVSADVDEDSGPAEQEIKARCPSCSEINSLMWPKSESGWVITVVRLIEEGRIQ